MTNTRDDPRYTPVLEKIARAKAKMRAWGITPITERRQWKSSADYLAPAIASVTPIRRKA